MNKVTRYTRAGADGRAIQSSCCHGRVVVFHLAWSALLCPECHGEVEKTDWVAA